MLICFYIGYSPDFDSNTVGGSELALLNVAQGIARQKIKGQFPKVVVYGFQTSSRKDEHNVVWSNASSLMYDTEKIDVLIISRYINIFLHIPDIVKRSSKIYIWLHDIIFHNAYQGVLLPENGRYIVENMLPKINGITCQSDWHKGILKNLYPGIDQNLILKFPNGVDNEILDFAKTATDNFTKRPTKVKHSFVWASHHSRGIENLTRIFPLIKSLLPHATLKIFGEAVPERIEDVMILKTIPGVTYVGKTDHASLFKEMLQTDIFFYPTTFQETYCMLALEAQLAGCICFVPPIAALNETIGNRGVIIHEATTDGVIAQGIHDVMNNDTIVETLAMRSITWAKDQTWDSRVLEWIKLF